MPVRPQSLLYDELSRAIAATGPEDLKEWGKVSAKRLPAILARRVKNLGRLAARIGKATTRELSDTFRAWREGQLGKHLEDRVAAGIDGSIEVVKQTAAAIGTVGNALINDPKKNAPDVFALALGFYAGSGGLDGNGGIPDSDLALGIGWHRSVFTHSIIAGAVVEGAILAVADLADIVCQKLPNDHAPFWDQLRGTKDRIALQLAAGTSAGIAYHLAVDATVQPAPYHDWPFGMATEGHQMAMGVFAVAEGLDVANKTETTGQKVVSGIKTAGGDVMKGAATGAEAVWNYGRGFISGFKGGGK